MNEKIEKKTVKTMNIRLPVDLWSYIKHKSIKTHKSVNGLLVDYIYQDQVKDKKKGCNVVL